MRPRHPIWLVKLGEEHPGRHRLASRPDDDRDDPDTGLLLIDVTDELEISTADSDDRYPHGWLNPSPTLQPSDASHPHWTENNLDCASNRCDHATELPCHYQHTDMGWWLVIGLPDGAKAWVHEDDVPIDNHPADPAGGPFCRRPPREDATTGQRHAPA